ncbi:MAG TPA: hypothetical protein VEZ71_24635, partial [Archangium sp.]|nr:hypothetical protein [Archangium sp.]
MSGGLKVGDLYVSVTASIGEAVKSLASFTKTVEKTADEVSKTLNGLSTGFLAVTALAGGFVAAATASHQGLKDATDELTKASQTFAVEVAKDFVPLIKEMVRGIKTAIATYRNLDKETRANIVAAVKWAAVLGTGMKLLGAGAGMAKSFAGGLGGLLKAAGPASNAVSAGFFRILTSAKAASASVSALGKVTLPGLSPVFAKVTGSAARASKALQALDVAALVKRLGIPARASISSLAAAVRSGVVASARAASSAMAGVAASTRAAFASIAAQGGVVKATGNGIRSAAASMSAGVATAFQSMVSASGSAAAAVRAGVTGGVAAVRSGVVASARAASSAMAGVAASARAAFASIAAQGGVVKATGNGIRSAAASMSSGMATAFRTMARSAGGGTSSVARHMTGARLAVLAFIKAPLSQHLTVLGNGLRSLALSLLALPKNIGGMFAALRAGFAAFAGGTPVILAVAVALGGIVLLAGSLYKSWGDITYLWKESTAGLVESMQRLGETAASFFGEMWTGVKDFIVKAARVAMSMVAGTVRAFAMFLKPVTTALRMENATKALSQLSTMTGDEMLDKLLSGMSQAADIVTDAGRSAGAALASATKGVRGDIAYGLKHSVEGAKDLGAKLKEMLPIDQLRALKDSLSGFIPNLGSPDSVELRDTLTETANAATDALKAVRDVTGALLDVALLEKRLYEQRIEHLRGAIGAVGDRLFNVDLRGPMESYKKTQEAIAERAKKLADALKEARDGLKQTALSRMGEAPSIVESGIQGFVAGGPLGAVAAVFADLLTRSEQFKTIVEMVNTVVQKVADVLGQMLTPLMPLVGAVLNVVDVVVSSLGPALTSVGQVLEPLAPMFMLLGTMLAPLFQVLGSVLQALMKPINALVSNAMPALFEVFKVVGLVIMNLVLGIREVWNGILEGVRSILGRLAELE